MKQVTHTNTFGFTLLLLTNINRKMMSCLLLTKLLLTFDTGAAVATYFGTNATDDESSKVVLVSADTEQNTTNKTNRDEFMLIVVPTNDPYLADLEDNDEINLEQFEMMETVAYRKKIIDLFKIQYIMKKYDQVRNT